jgi:RNA polymerase sigma-70 factor (ECF subfamily)
MEQAAPGSNRDDEEDLLPGLETEDAALVARARSGDKSALEEIVRVHAAPVYRIVAAYVGQGDAEDATQETFVQIQQGLASFEGRARLGTWIFRIATNVALKRLRRRKRKPPLAAIEGAEAVSRERGPLAVAQEGELRAAFQEALLALPEDQRAVVVLRGIEGLPFEEVAETLGIPLPTAHSRMARACEKLKQRLRRFTDAGALAPRQGEP